MTIYVVEHRIKGYYAIDIVADVEDLDVAPYENSLIGIWVCHTMDEADMLEQELKEMRHAKRSSEPSEALY